MHTKPQLLIQPAKCISNRYGHKCWDSSCCFVSSGGSHNELWFWHDTPVLPLSRRAASSSYAIQCGQWELEQPLGKMVMTRREASCHERYVIEEAIPLSSIRQVGCMMTTGCPMGALPCTHFFLQHPDVLTKVTPQWSLRRMFLRYDNDDAISPNSPVDYIWNQNDGWFITTVRQKSSSVRAFCAWEQDHPSTKLKEAFGPETNSAFGLLNGDLRPGMVANKCPFRSPAFIKELPMNYLVISYYPQNFQHLPSSINKGIMIGQNHTSNWMSLCAQPWLSISV